MLQSVEKMVEKLDRKPNSPNTRHRSPVPVPDASGMYIRTFINQSYRTFDGAPRKSELIAAFSLVI